ncbi:hypothetical protein R1sor_024621 [Riccia sorocarpa]|uniref:Gag-pol polyprotein n=1 Tax=Riccia sorocarpa TaxID=122646 RepID=A0ABD3GU68_9MARC
MASFLNSIPESEKLQGDDNYTTWKWKIQSILEREGVWHAFVKPPPAVKPSAAGSTAGTSSTVTVTGGSATTSTTASAPKTLTDAQLVQQSKAMSVLKLSLSDDVIPHIIHLEDPRELWIELDKLYNTRTNAKRLATLKRFTSLKMDTSSTVTKFMREVRDLINQLAEYGDKPKEELIAGIIINALPDSFSSMVAYLSAEKQMPTLQDLNGRLKQEEDRQKTLAGPEDTDALAVRIHRYLRNRTPSRGNFDKSKIICNRCGIAGHIARDCRVDLTKQFKENKPAYALTEGSTEETITDEEMEAAIAALSLEDQNWYVDSGAAAHVTGSANGLDQIKEVGSSGIVKTAGGHSLPIHGKGTVMFRVQNGEMKKVSDILYVPGLRMPTLPQSDKICPECVAGKLTRKSFPKKASTRATEILELIHSDIWGPFPTQSIGGKRYFISFIDDHSRKCWIFTLRRKSEALETFVRFKAHIELLTGKYIKTLRTDRGGEYTAKAFAAYCAKYGIQRQLSIAYTPQQNGVSERKNRTILDRARSMVAGKNLPAFLWAEVVNTANYLINRSPTKANAGYDEVSKGYRCYSASQKKIIISRDIRFDESALGLSSTDLHNSTDLYNELLLCSKLYDESCTDSFTGTPIIPDPLSTGAEPETPTSLSTNNQPSSTEQTAALQAIQPAAVPTPEDDLPVAEPQDAPSQEPEIQPNSSIEIRGLRRSTRATKRPSHFSDYHVGMVILPEPATLQEAEQYPEWQAAMQTEMEAIHKNKTWRLAELPADKKAITAKWVFRRKDGANGKPPIYKARLVARGFQQQKGVDYKETYAPVAKWDTIRTVIATAAQNSWQLLHLDVRTAFLNGVLEEEVYMEQPPGFQALDRSKCSSSPPGILQHEDEHRSQME